MSKFGQSVEDMDGGQPLGLATRLRHWSHLLLAGHLLLLHVLAFGGWRVLEIRFLWMVALGLFLIWQPFIAGERRISPVQSLLLLAGVIVSAVLLGPWLLLMWCGALAAVIGGRVLWTDQRRERSGYLLAFGYLIGVTVLGVVPEVSPAVKIDAELRGMIARFMPLLLPFLLLFPARIPFRRSGEAFDLFYGLLVFLVLAVFVLGALAYMLVGGGGYVESLFKTSIAVACALLIVAWAWNPRAGFSGIGTAVSRYLLTLGMPLEQWLVHLSAESEHHRDPESFLAACMRHLGARSWVIGISWQTDGHVEKMGEQSSHVHSCAVNDLSISLHFHHAPSPAMRWHVEWLLRLVIEFYLVKRQSRQLQQMTYVQAIHETGARVTHDVKNLLQSLQVLCFAASQPGDPAELAGLLRRQLPQIAERLKVTLDKLQSPQAEVPLWKSASAWWSELLGRYVHAGLLVKGEAPVGRRVPSALFDSVAENLLQNALAKRQREPDLQIELSFLGDGFQVCDNGSAITPTVARSLFAEPIASEDGLGIGLYQAKRQAESQGYALTLVENRSGCVQFRLLPMLETLPAGDQ